MEAFTFHEGLDKMDSANVYDSPKHNVLRKRDFWTFLKFVVIVGFSMACIGSMMHVVSTNQKLQAQIISAMRKNTILSSRARRDALTIKSLAASAEEREDRLKRSAADAEEQRNVLALTPGFGAGVTYIRWGRRECSGPNNELIYHGIAAGSWYAHTGGTSKPSCLDMNVTYTPGRYMEGRQGNAYFYGMEYRDTAWVNNLLDLSLTEGTLQFNSVPCVICMARTRINKLMIPGRETCPEGWFLEYTGYMMGGGHNDKHSSESLCVDDTPQVVPGTQGNQNGAYLHMMEMTCTSVLCEPFVNAREIRCVVCTI